jgi:hypothetical protein
MKINVRLIYLYLFSFVGLLVVVIGLIQIVDLGLKVWVFKDADKYEYYSAPKIEGQPLVDEAVERGRLERESTRQRQRQLSTSLAMILVGTPLYLYHWKLVQKKH